MNTFSEFDNSILLLIQKTPSVEILAKTLRRRGFDIDFSEKEGTRFQKCRRLYDSLLQDCLQCSDEQSEQLKKFFHDAGNSSAGELLFSLKVDMTPIFLRPEDPHYTLTRADVSNCTRTFMKIFRTCKSGNAQKLGALLKGVALKCAGFQNLPLPHRTTNLTLKNVNMEQYRSNLGESILTKRDWMDKTLLHVAADGKSINCINVILQVAQEARVKSKLLDAIDIFGQTPLHLAIRRKYVGVAKKLILEGANIFLKNNAGHSCLRLIFQRLPALATFLLDGAITISGEVSADSLNCHIDFGILTAPTDFSKCSTESRLKDDGCRIQQTALDTKARFHSVVEIHDLMVETKSDEKEDTENDGSSNPPLLPTQKLLPTISKLNENESNLKATEIAHLCKKKSKRKRKRRHDHAKSDSNQISSPPSSLENVEMTILGWMVYSGHKSLPDLLSHPVTEAFLDLKWSRMRLLLFLSYTALRIGVYGFYIFLMHQIYFHYCPLKKEGQLQSSKKCDFSHWSQYLLPFVIMFNSLFLVHELVKALDMKKLRNFKRYLLSDPGPLVLVRALFLSVVIGTCVPPYIKGTMESYQYPLATVGIIIASGLILQVISNSNWSFGIHSIYIHIYGKVMIRFFSVIATFSPLLIAFSLGLNILYPDTKQFGSFPRSLLRLIIMLQGEFDFEDKIYAPNNETFYFSEENGENYATQREDLVFWSGQILFATLGCVLTLVLIDVFLGYTVSDINELKKQAEFVRRCNEIEQMHETERFVGIAVKMLNIFGLNSSKLVDYFNILSRKRRSDGRTDVVVSFGELEEYRQSQFRQIFVEEN